MLYFYSDLLLVLVGQVIDIVQHGLILFDDSVSNLNLLIKVFREGE